MKVLIPIEYHVATGGAIHSVALLIDGLVRAGARVAALVPCAGQTQKRFIDVGAEVHVGKFEVVSKSEPRNVWLRRMQLLYRLARYGALFASTIRRFQPELIHYHTYAPAVSASLFGVRPPPETRQLLTVRTEDPNARALRVVARWVARERVCVSATTAYQQRFAAKAFSRRSEDIPVIPNAVDLAQWAVDGARPLPGDWPITSDRACFRVGVLGYPSENKCQEMLVEAARLLKINHDDARPFPYRFYIIGDLGSQSDRDYYARLQRMVDNANLGAYVCFTGYLAPVALAFRSLDCVAVTSLAEGFGRSIIEAWASGVPVIATRSGGPECLIDDGETGYLVDRRAADALADRIALLATNPRVAARLAQNGLDVVRRDFDNAVCVQRWLTLYSTLCSQAHPR